VTPDPTPPLPPKPSAPKAELLAFALSLLWLGALVGAFRVLGDGGRTLAESLGLVVVALAVFLPIALIWLAVLVLRAARQMRDEARRLHLAVEAMRQGWLREQQAAGRALDPTMARKLDEIAQTQRQTEETLALFSTRRVPPPPALHPAERTAPPDARPDAAPGTEGAQSALALGATVAAAPPLQPDIFLRALNFPESETDEEGFEALRLALTDHATAQLLRAAQDVLTALSQEGIFMDDLRPDQARPEVWRAFAAGMRGPSIAALGGVRDRSCLALTAGRMRSDPAFREAAHRFLRAFDLRFAWFEGQASDGDIARFARTRSARAFMLLGRVTGMFG